MWRTIGLMFLCLMIGYYIGNGSITSKPVRSAAKGTAKMIDKAAGAIHSLGDKPKDSKDSVD